MAVSILEIMWFSLTESDYIYTFQFMQHFIEKSQKDDSWTSRLDS